MEAVLISACLLGMACRYDGKSRPLPENILKQLQNQYQLVPFCPEIYGGLPTPRPPAERRSSMVVTAAGEDVTVAYEAGAAEGLALAQLFGCRLAILKEKSPSCGSGCIYDGTFTRNITARDGVTAQLLKKNGIRILGESQIQPHEGANPSDTA